jgi:dihydropyrimidinase
MSILITNGRVVTGDGDSIADIFIDGETVSAIGSHLPMEAETIIDARGRLVMPGGIDPHVHLALPSMGTVSSDDYTTGTGAALFGGTTTVIDFVTQTKGLTLYQALDAWHGRADGKACGDYAFHMIVTDFNDASKAEISRLVENDGITSFKAFMACKDTLMIDDRQIVALMTEVKRCGGIMTVHATNGDMIDALKTKHRAEGRFSPLYHALSQPEITESEATGRFAAMAGQTGVPSYVVHLTCEGALNQIRSAAGRNQKVFAETCTQYLLLDASVYGQDFEGAKWVMSPPLRTKKDQDALWAGIDQGTIQVVASDHCPFTWEQKMMGIGDFSKIPNGFPGIEHRMELVFSEGVHTGKISLNRFVEVTSTNAAKIFGMFPKKGCIAAGSDADIVIFDPDEEHTITAAAHHMNVDYSGFEGWKVRGKVKTVLLRGTVAVDDGTLAVPPGFGRYVKRSKVNGII